MKVRIPVLAVPGAYPRAAGFDRTSAVPHAFSYSPVGLYMRGIVLTQVPLVYWGGIRLYVREQKLLDGAAIGCQEVLG